MKSREEYGVKMKREYVRPVLKLEEIEKLDVICTSPEIIEGENTPMEDEYIAL